jgi:HSP20 family protein
MHKEKRFMANIQPYHPFNDLLSLRDATNRLFEATFPRSLQQYIHSGGNIDLYETANGYDVHIPIPGAKPEEVDITLHNNVVTVRWEHAPKPPEGSKNLHRGIQYGTFQEQFTLPMEPDADATGASFKDGILSIHFPKAEQSKSRKIKVSTR